MPEDIIYGIDLGTTFSAAAFVNAHGEPVCVHLGADGKWTIPSAVLLTGEKKAFVGDEAIEKSWVEGSLLIQFVKQDIGLRNGRNWEYNGWRYEPEEISSLILRKIKQEISRDRSLPPIRDVVITHPQYFYINQKEATREAGDLAGLNVVATITEPNAAAIAYGICDRAEEAHKEITVLVFDLGGGTFDVSLMKVGKKRFEMLGSDGDPQLGGINWDDEIVAFAKDHFHTSAGEAFDDIASQEEKNNLRKEAQRAKEELSKNDAHLFSVEGGGQRMRVTLPHVDFVQMTRHLVARCVELCESLFEKTSYDWSRIDQVLMVGSSSKMPIIQEEIRRLSGKKLIIDREPKLMVAKGAAIWGHWIKHKLIDPRWREAENQEPSGIEIPPEVSGRTARGLGVLAKKGGQQIVEILVPQNMSTPCEEERTFFTDKENATSVRILLYEGESEDPRRSEIIGEVIIDKLPPRPKGSPVKVKFNIDLSGRLEVQATEVETGSKEIKVIDKNILRDEGGEPNDDPQTRRRHLAEIEVR